MNEFELIDRYFRRAPRNADVRIGIGDDGAVIAPAPGMEYVVTVDMLVEGRHFRADADPRGVGHKTLAVNLSDLAAMGALPRFVLLAGALPASDPGWVAAFMFGNPETTTGGNALKFYASVRLDIRRIGSIKRGDEVVGNETRVKVVKNKVSPPFREALFDILYGEGISREGEIIELGVNHRIVEKSGAWYAYAGDKIGQGKDNAREFLREHPAVAAEIEAKIRETVGVPTPSRIKGDGNANGADA